MVQRWNVTLCISSFNKLLFNFILYVRNVSPISPMSMFIGLLSYLLFKAEHKRKSHNTTVFSALLYCSFCLFPFSLNHYNPSMKKLNLLIFYFFANSVLFCNFVLAFKLSVCNYFLNPKAFMIFV